MYARLRDVILSMLLEHGVNESSAVARTFILRLLEFILHAIALDCADKNRTWSDRQPPWVAKELRGGTFNSKQALFGRDYGRSHT